MQIIVGRVCDTAMTSQDGRPLGAVPTGFHGDLRPWSAGQKPLRWPAPETSTPIPRRMRTDSSNRQQSPTIDWLAHPRSSWRCLVPRLLPRLTEDALAEPRSFWPAVGLGWRSCCWRRVCCAESVWEGPATEVMVRAPPPRTEDQHLERSSPVGQAGRYGPGVLQGGRSDRLRGECAAIRVLFGGGGGLANTSRAQTTGRSIPHTAHTIPNGDGCLF